MKSYYDLLNIGENADKKTIKRAFYKLAKKFHPDLSNNASMFINILNAYEILIDDEKRHDYNSMLQSGRVLPKNRVSFALSLKDIVDLRYFNRGKTRWYPGYYNPKGYDVCVSLTQKELKTGSVVNIDIPAHVICPLCMGDRVHCALCSYKGYVLRAVPVPVYIPKSLEDGEIFSVQLRKKKQKEYAFFRMKTLNVKIRIMRE